MIYDNILGTIGQTPVVKINQLGKHLNCTLYAKCEYFNPGGSIKDRIAVVMLEAAEREGYIKPGDILIEPTSGNTGIGIALTAAIKGYAVIITMPAKMSMEKQVVLERLGAKIYRTRTEAAWNDPDSHISLAKQLHASIPNSYILDQYTNPNNPKTHYDLTATEILNDFDGHLDMLVAGAGTGGSITGIAKKLKAQCPDIQIIGVDPIGSILAGGDDIAPYLVEGIGYDFIPKVLDNQLIDSYIKVSDQDAFQTARDLVRHEGLLVGGSCGAAMWGALQAAKTLQAGQKCLVILPDSIRNYLSKYANDEWMHAHGFL